MYQIKKLNHYHVYFNLENSFGWKHGWGTKKDYFLLYPMDPLTKKHVIILSHIHVESWFSSRINKLLRYYSMHNMLNLNKFQNSYQVLEKIQDFVSWEKKSSRTHKDCLNNFFWPKILTTNTLNRNVIKCMNVTKTKCSIAM